MDNKYKIISEIKCSVCGKTLEVPLEIYADCEDQAISWANREVYKSALYSNFESKHSKHKNIEKYTEVGIL